MQRRIDLVLIVLGAAAVAGGCGSESAGPVGVGAAGAQSVAAGTQSSGAGAAPASGTCSPGYTLCDSGCVDLSTASGSGFDPPHSYELDSTDGLETAIRNGAGPQ